MELEAEVFPLATLSLESIIPFGSFFFFFFRARRNQWLARGCIPCHHVGNSILEQHFDVFAQLHDWDFLEVRALAPTQLERLSSCYASVHG